MPAGSLGNHFVRPVLDAIFGLSIWVLIRLRYICINRHNLTLIGTAAPLQFEGTFTYGGTIVATGLPVTAVEKTGTAIDARMLFVRRKDALTAGLTYTPHFSADLLTWQPSYEEPTVLADDGTYQVVSVPYPVLVDGNKPRFSRLGVTLAP